MDMNLENKFDFVLSNISSEPKKSVNEALSSLNHIEDLESIIRSSADLIISTDIECEVLAKNNRMITIFWSFSSLINQNNEIIGTLGIGKDISKQKYLKKKDIH